MADAARSLFDLLTTYRRVKDLIDEGETEGQYLECKAPTEPRLTNESKTKLARSASGFANSGGGVIIWGVSTTKHAHTGLDVLTEIEPIGNVRRLAQQIDRDLPRLTNPHLGYEESRILHRVQAETRGIAITYIPPTEGDPVQSTTDRTFYIRTGDEFHEMPYDTLQRMFTGAQAPVLRPVFDPRLVKIDEKGIWDVRIVIDNDSTAAARDVSVVVDVLNPGQCESITSTTGLKDMSPINPGLRTFIESVDEPIFRGLAHLTGSLLVQMKTGQRPKRSLSLQVRIFADRMRAREWTFKVNLARSGFSVRDIIERFVY